ncbi:MAG: hypothetical protein QGI24_07035 [Kiritimatiellia bacterium]|jgi:hypothetical protein|nr:hypothetical protein [Kiritimatiellia bacterium]MDP6848528.1 hypothetical protein [Kiritimatiellia bacterium]
MRKDAAYGHHEFDDGFVVTFLSPAIHQNRGETIIKFMTRLPQERDEKGIQLPGFGERIHQAATIVTSHLSQMANVA